MTDVIFYFDFGSPNAYLAHKVIPAIEARSGAKFVYVPALLGGIFKATGNRSPAEAYAGIPLKLAYEGRETERFVKKHGIGTMREMTGRRWLRQPRALVNSLGVGLVVLKAGQVTSSTPDRSPACSSARGATRAPMP